MLPKGIAISTQGSNGMIPDTASVVMLTPRLTGTKPVNNQPAARFSVCQANQKLHRPRMVATVAATWETDW